VKEEGEGREKNCRRGASIYQRRREVGVAHARRIAPVNAALSLTPRTAAAAVVARILGPGPGEVQKVPGYGAG
jgi:hypothetical protein